jgi:hypothetical protein
MPLSLVDLLNPSDPEGQRIQAEMHAGLVDIQPQLQRLAAFPAHGVRATRDIQQHLLSAIEYLEAHQLLTMDHPPRSPPPQRPLGPPTPAEDPTLATNVSLTSKTTLSILYRYPPHTVIEHLETSTVNPVGHFFRMDPNDWQVPDLNIAYSRGQPMGQTKGGTEVFFRIMVDKEGIQVPCSERHSTCSCTTYIGLEYYSLIHNV